MNDPNKMAGWCARFSAGRRPRWADYALAGQAEVRRANGEGDLTQLPLNPRED
jgi:hypothetical protein